MHIVVVDGFAPDDADRHVAATAVDVLEAAGHSIERLDLHADGFETPMSAEERRAYDSGTPLITPETKRSAEAIGQANALLFCYRTTLYGVPPVVKSWAERVLVEGVSFEFDSKNRIRPALTHVRRLGVLTTSPHSAAATRRARDLGRRTIMWTLRLNCHRLCRRTFVRLPIDVSAAQAAARITPALAAW